MQHPQHRKVSLPILHEHFPTGGHIRQMWGGQRDTLGFVAKHGSGVMIVEAPTGTGKTASMVAILKAIESLSKSGNPQFLVTTNKTLVEQVGREFPELKIAMGRNEHPCLYYEEPPRGGFTDMSVQKLANDPENFKADEIPCSMLHDCPHRVDQETGETHEEGAYPCPYLKQKFEAKQGGIVVSTVAFYLFTHLFSGEFELPEGLVVDEAHRMADAIRSVLSYEITDHHLELAVDRLESVASEEAAILERFRKRMVQMMKRRKKFQPKEGVLLDDEELIELIDILQGIDVSVLKAKIKDAVRAGELNVREDRVVLKQLETLLRDLRRYIRSFEYSMSNERHGPLNYTYAFYKEEKGENERVQYKLVVKSYYVAPLIKKLLAPTTVAFSATIGNPEVFGYETGIRGPFLSIASHFPAKNARIFMPTDTPNLAMKSRSKGEPARVLRKITRTCRRFADHDQRSLVVTISNAEREKFLLLCEEEGLEAISYGNGMTAKEAALRFKGGEGDVLVGTAANYAEGVDLPRQIAPVIFFLRPGYPNPRDPGTQFEEKRFCKYRNQKWQIWNWRVMLQALQVRGRNIRSRSDIGITFFVSQQFRRFLFSSLSEKMKEDAYVGDKSFDECVENALEVLVGDEPFRV